MKKKIIAFLLAMGMISSLAAAATPVPATTSGSGSNTVANENLPEPGEAASAEVTGDTLTISCLPAPSPRTLPPAPLWL